MKVEDCIFNNVINRYNSGASEVVSEMIETLFSIRAVISQFVNNVGYTQSPSLNWYIYIYIYTVGLTLGGSSTVHIYTNNTQNTESRTYIINKKLNIHNNKKIN
jgi:hypothetical protein